MGELHAELRETTEDIRVSTLTSSGAEWLNVAAAIFFRCKNSYEQLGGEILNDPSSHFRWILVEPAEVYFTCATGQGAALVPRALACSKKYTIHGSRSDALPDQENPIMVAVLECDHRTKLTSRGSEPSTFLHVRLKTLIRSLMVANPSQGDIVVILTQLDLLPSRIVYHKREGLPSVATCIQLRRKRKKTIWVCTFCTLTQWCNTEYT